MHDLLEIEIPYCYVGKVRRFNTWRLAVAEMTGFPLYYTVAEKPVSLRSLGPNAAPTRLPFVEARPSTVAGELTPARRLGHWDGVPDDPLNILLLLTVPGSVIRHDFAALIAGRLAEMVELMHAIDDGRRGTIDLGGFTERIEQGMRRIAEKRVDVAVRGGYEPGGWWDVAGTCSQ